MYHLACHARVSAAVHVGQESDPPNAGGTQRYKTGQAGGVDGDFHDDGGVEGGDEVELGLGGEAGLVCTVCRV